MKTRHVIGLSILSSLLTLLAVFIVLSDSGIAAARKPVPTPTPLPQITPQDPNALTENSERPAMNEAPEQPNAVAATTDYQHVAGSAFVPLYDDAGVTYGSKGCTYLSSATHLFMNYSLDLPNHSTVTAVRLYFNDTAPTTGTLHLAQYDDGAAYTYLATVTTSGSSGLGSATVSGLTITLDYLNYNYVMYWMPGISGSTMQLCGFRVNYTRPFVGANFLPAVLNDAGQ
jgi:hypothetical protein